MAEPHPLDIAYRRWFDSAIIPANKETLFAEVLVHCRRLCRSEDAAQDSVVYILNHFDTFVCSKPDGFSRWISSICRRRRLEAVRQTVKDRLLDEVTDDSFHHTEDPAWDDWSVLPLYIRSIAEQLFDGQSIEEIAELLGVKPKSVWKKVQRHLSPKVAFSS